MPRLSLPKLILCIAVSEAAGLVVTPIVDASVSTWYAFLAMPPLSPPNWLFGPVWTVLYLLMGIAAYLVWREGDRQASGSRSQGWRAPGVKAALGLFIAQLVLNSLWTYIFFGLHQPAFAFGEIVAMWILILLTIIAFARVSRPAAWLMVPYVLWVSFAAYLNLGVWLLNR